MLYADKYRLYKHNYNKYILFLNVINNIDIITFMIIKCKYHYLML